MPPITVWGLGRLLVYVWPNSFKGEFTSNKFFRFSFADGFYFSVCTLTTVGFGDVLACGPEARCLTMMEAMLGVLYPAVLISRLVGLHTSSAGPGPRPPASEAPPPVASAVLKATVVQALHVPIALRPEGAVGEEAPGAIVDEPCVPFLAPIPVTAELLRHPAAQHPLDESGPCAHGPAIRAETHP